MRKFLSRLAMALCLSAPFSTPLWAEFSPESVVSGDIVNGWRTDQGRYFAGIRLRLQPGWKTYWRVPGEAGVPTQVTWAGSQNLKSVRVHWPRPSLFEQNGLRSIGYAHEVVLPVELTPRDAGQPVTLNAQVQLGLCRDVCIPAEITLSGQPGAAPDPGPIRAALANRPERGAAVGLGDVRCQIEPIADGLRLRTAFRLARLGAGETAVVEWPDPSVWIAPVTLRREGDLLIAETELVPESGAPFALDRSRLRFTLLAQDRAIDVRGCSGAP